MTFKLPPPITDLKHIGVDLDGTLAKPVWTPENPTSEIGDPIWPNIRQVYRLKEAGYKIYIYTSRSWTDQQSIDAWCEFWSVPIDGIYCGKPLFKMLFDDRGCHVDSNGGLDWVETVKSGMPKQIMSARV